MSEINQQLINRIVQEVINKLNNNSADCPIKKIMVPQMSTTEEHRMHTGNPNDQVWTRDLFTLEESPRLGCGLMVMKETTFPWTLNYDEIDYVIEGRLEIHINGQVISADPGEIILIPKGSSIAFSAPGSVRFLYFVYPADWQAQK